ncbi:threonine aldolase family protein [Lichenicoccus roseus]|uniref:L-threonine aldolase n=1 Tax=Lichenicoccus roseus TaxID=2683649 RepID=A0A5R9J201_9PROT|nr:beta-eliminating lyase-related protein [Lichenicoccus roseus]TLU71665.1 low specificity L-threonine aldolase [Lichenicoccus roseus]
MTVIRKNFGSDNVGPAHPQVVQAMLEANRGAVASYGGDPWTARVGTLIDEIFQTETTVFPVATGTAANALALSALVRPFGAIVCDEVAHIMNDEAGAPEFFTGGAKLLTLPSPDGRMDPEVLQATLARRRISGVHQSPVEAISLTQATEWGTCYPVSRIAALSAVARENRLHVHMDGARFANAIDFLGATPAAVTWQAGVDVLSLGATKNGAMAAEAVVFFNRDLAREFAQRRKRGGHLWSKQRFLSAQLTGYLEGGLWLQNGARANAAALRLSQGLAALPGVAVVQPTEANEVFAALPEPLVVRLEAAGYGFYRWARLPGDGGIVVRLVCAFDTTEADVDALLGKIRRDE